MANEGYDVKEYQASRKPCFLRINSPVYGFSEMRSSMKMIHAQPEIRRCGIPKLPIPRLSLRCIPPKALYQPPTHHTSTPTTSNFSPSSLNPSFPKVIQ